MNTKPRHWEEKRIQFVVIPGDQYILPGDQYVYILLCLFQTKNAWKFPGGLSELGEDIGKLTYINY